MSLGAALVVIATSFICCAGTCDNSTSCSSSEDLHAELNDVSLLQVVLGLEATKSQSAKLNHTALTSQDPESVTGDDVLTTPLEYDEEDLEYIEEETEAPPEENSSEEEATQLAAPVVKKRPTLFPQDWQSFWVPPEFSNSVSEWQPQQQCALEVQYRPKGGSAGDSTGSGQSPCRATQKIVMKEKHVNISVPKLVYKDVPVTVNATRERFVYKNSSTVVQKVVEEVTTRKKIRTVEVPLYIEKITYVRVVEVPVPVDIIQEQVVFKTVDQIVERRVEVPNITATKRKVEVPVYNVVIKEVPKIEVRQRVVEVVREELEVVPNNEAVELLEEKLVEEQTETVKRVELVRELGQNQPEAVDVPQFDVIFDKSEVYKSVPVTRQINVTQEVVDTEEEIEEVEKVVEVVEEQEQVVEVPKIITQYVNKEVMLTTVHERIQQVRVLKSLELLNEVAETVIERLPVELRHEQLVTEVNRSFVPVIREKVTAKKVASNVSIKNLVPEPYAIHEDVANAQLETQESAPSATENTSGCGNVIEMVREVIVADYQEEEQVYEREVPTTVTVFKDVEVPVEEIKVEVVKMPVEQEEEVLVEVPQIYEVEKLVEVQDADCEASVPLPANDSAALSLARHAASGHKSEQAGSRQKINCSGMRIQKREVTMPKVTKKVVEVPLYRLVEKVIEVPVERTVEEIEEVPVVVDLESHVEVTQVEYKDTVVEKVIKKRVELTYQQALKVQRDVVAKVEREVLQVDEQELTVPLKTQYVQTVRQNMKVGQEVTQPFLELTPNTRQQNVTKKVKLKKRVEKLVPKTVTKIKPKYVEVVQEVIQERLVPVYHEKEVVKYVEVAAYTVSQKNVTKRLTWQEAYATTVSFNTTVALESQEGLESEEVKEVEVLEGTPNAQTKSVPIAVPCSPPSPTNGSRGPITES